MITNYLKYVNDKAYIVKREMPHHNFIKKGDREVNLDVLAAWRDFLGCNHVLQTQTHFLMCERIEDVEIIEEDA